MDTIEAKFLLPAILFCSSLFGQDTVSFKEETFWKEHISIKPHGLYYGSGLSPNGTFFLGDSGNLVKVNLPSGSKEFIVKATNPDEYAWSSVVSPDSRHIAYSWFNGDGFDLMLVENSNAEKRSSSPRLLVKGAMPYDWSPDGKWILVSIIDTNWMAKIALVSPEDGSVKILREAGKQLFNKMSFSPDGKYLIYDYAANGQNDIYIMDANGERSDRLVNDSSSKFGPYWSPDGKYIFFMVKDGTTNNLSAIRVLNGKTFGSVRLVKKNINWSAPLGFIKNGSFLYGSESPVQLDVYIAELDPVTQKIVTAPKLLSNKFPGMNTDAILSSNGKLVAYKSRRNSNNVIVVKNLHTQKEGNVPCGEISLLQWFGDNNSLFADHHDDDKAVDILYRVNINTGKNDSLLELKSDYTKSIIKHHPVISPDGKLIYYIETDFNSNRSDIVQFDMTAGIGKRIATLDSRDITSFSISPSGRYLSMVVLYQLQKGRPSALRTLDLQSKEIHELFKTPWGDATKFFGVGWSHDAKYMYYVRSDTATSSSFLWRIMATGGVPQKTGLSMIDLRMPQVHPDGKHILFYGGKGWYNKLYEITAITPVHVTLSSKQ